MQPATENPSEFELQKLLLGTLEADRAEEVLGWLENNPSQSKSLGKIVANDSFTAAIGESASAEDVPVESIERIAKNVKQILSASLPRQGTAETGSWVGSHETADIKAPLPATLGTYRVIRELGRGGMGIVVEAEDPRLHRRVAIKFMNPELAKKPQAEARFLKEARLAAAIEHENVVPIHEVNEDNGVPFIVMPLLRGESLKSRLQRESPLPIPEIVRIGQQIAAGLAAAHARSVLHRDIKPANIWLDKETGRARILDFGLARHGDELAGLTAPGTILGTPAYMAPEQIDGKPVDEKCDLFSLGAILYECATGQQAFAGKTLTAILHAVANHNPPAPMSVNPKVPPALSAFIEKLLAKDPGKRPQSAREAADALAAIEKGQVPPAPGKTRRKQRLIVASMMLAFCLAIVAVWSMISWNRSNGTVHAGMKGATEPTNSGDSFTTKPTQMETFRVKSVDVKHYENAPERDIDRGVLGVKSFTPLLGDRVRIMAKLSRPGYAYIIAFRPDGVAELCFPNDENTVPPLTATPRYPITENGKVYGLREGTGLWVFAVLASEKPLPTFNQWLASRKPNWKPEAVPNGSVWWYDGAVLEEVTAGNTLQRSKDEELRGPGATVRSLGQWLEQTPDTTIGIIGFGVGKRN